MADLHTRIDSARAAGKSMVRVVDPIDCDEPWQLALAIQEGDTRVMAWSGPSEGGSPLIFIAAGISAELRPTGGARFNDASQWWTTIRDQIVELDGKTGEQTTSGAPACLAGFAFSTGMNRSEAWKGWSDGAICIPEILVVQNHGGTHAVFTLQADEGLEKLERLRTQLASWLEGAQPSAAPLPANGGVHSVKTETSDWTAWEQRVEAARSSLIEGTMDKVVLARAQEYESGKGASFDPLGTTMALRDRQEDSTTFMIQRRDGQAFLGATPETLVRLDNGRVETVAMAGTRRRGQEASSDAVLSSQLLTSAKDRQEQQIVADAILQALEPVVSELHRPEDPEVVLLPDVQHLRTSISGQLRDHANIFDLLCRLHPTPAVGGLPREPALQWLDAHEPLDRGWYAGPIGWLDAQGNGEFVVAIRSVLMAGHQAAAFAGCGLVAHSDARDEWEESVVKLQTVRRGLAFRTGAES